MARRSALIAIIAALAMANVGFVRAAPGLTWHPVGTTGPASFAANQAVRDLVWLGSELYAAGSFYGVPGDTAAQYLARWNGRSWSRVGTSESGGPVFNEPVLALAVSNGILYAGGKFTNAGGQPDADYLAQWDGESWSAVGSDGVNAPLPEGLLTTVESIEFDGDDMYIGGVFENVGGDPAADNIARYNVVDGWSALGSRDGDGAIKGGVRTIEPTTEGIYAGGSFRNANGSAAADGIVFWNGSTWQALGQDATGDGWLNGSVNTILKSGANLYVGGSFLNIEGDLSANYVARWDGAVWHPLGNVTDDTFDINDDVNELVMFNGKLVAGGRFSTERARRLASWNGSRWTTLGPSNGLSSGVAAVLVSGPHLYVAARVANEPDVGYVSLLTPARPDARIQRGSGALLGNGVYNDDAVSQSVSANATAGTTIEFKISAQNDGSIRDRYRFASSATSTSPGFVVRYFNGSTEITAAVESGTFLSPRVAPGGTFVIRARVRVTSAAPIGSSVTRLVTVTSSKAPPVMDAARFSVRRGS